MQIKFTPQKIKASKAYISNLIKNEKKYKKKSLLNGSFFKNIFTILFK